MRPLDGGGGVGASVSAAGGGGGTALHGEESNAALGPTAAPESTDVRARELPQRVIAPRPPLAAHVYSY